jgi:gentisate 1,2-dioxygenase
MQPLWKLDLVQELAAQERLFLTRAASTCFPTFNEALDWVHAAIAELEPGHFAHSVQLHTHRADVYGFVAEGCGWYLKLTVEKDSREEFVLVISCHPLEHPILTLRGTIGP